MISLRANMLRRAMALALGVLTCCTATGCSYRVWNTRQAPAQRFAELDSGAEFLRCHMRDGSLYVFSDWAVNARQRVITGTGNRHDADRQTVVAAHGPVPMDDVLLLQSVQAVAVNARGPVVVLATMSVVSAILLAVCLASGDRCVAAAPVSP